MSQGFISLCQSYGVVELQRNASICVRPTCWKSLEWACRLLYRTYEYSPSFLQSLQAASTRHSTLHVFCHVTKFKNFKSLLACPFTSSYPSTHSTLHSTQCRPRLSHRQSSQRHYQMSVDKLHQNYHIIQNPLNSSMQSNKH